MSEVRKEPLQMARDMISKVGLDMAKQAIKETIDKKRRETPTSLTMVIFAEEMEYLKEVQDALEAT